MRFLVTGGGTGGHLFPGIAVAEAVLERFPQGEVMFIGTGRQIDQAVLADRPFTVAAIASRGLKGTGGLGKLRAILTLPRGMLAALRLLRRFRPQVALGVGGYVTGPVLLAARLLGIPTCIHEQNAVPGLANRLLGRLVDRIFISLPESGRFFPAAKTVLTGNPVRREILARAGQPAAGNGPTLLVLGGSQGAHRLNELVAEGLAGLGQSLPAGLTVIHQSGVRDEAWLRSHYQQQGIAAVVAAFFDDMPERYAAADLVVCRAGATTLAELMVMGKPAIVIPYPFAADDHQQKNARFLVDSGAARMFLEPGLESGRLAGEIAGLLAAPQLRAKMGERARRLAKPEATERLLAECLALAAA